MSTVALGSSFGQSIDLSVNVNAGPQQAVVCQELRPVYPRVYDSYGYMENGVYYKRVETPTQVVVTDPYALSQERNNARWPALYGR